MPLPTDWLTSRNAHIDEILDNPIFINWKNWLSPGRNYILVGLHGDFDKNYLIIVPLKFRVSNKLALKYVFCYEQINVSFIYHLSNWISVILLYVFLEVPGAYIHVLDRRYTEFCKISVSDPKKTVITRL